MVIENEKELEHIMNIFKTNEIKTKPGMTQMELDEKEQLYGICFPYELRLLYSYVVPVGRRWYDWTDESPENIWYIKKMIELPVKTTISDVENNKCWMDEWGERPDGYDDRLTILLKHLRAAPKMIPFREHYFIPSAGPNEKGNPVFDFLQLCEAHCDAENLWLFSERFWLDRNKELGTVDYSSIKKVPFWHDVIGRWGIPVFPV